MFFGGEARGRGECWSSGGRGLERASECVGWDRRVEMGVCVCVCEEEGVGMEMEMEMEMGVEREWERELKEREG